jgi:hypothetical protein
MVKGLTFSDEHSANKRIRRVRGLVARGKLHGWNCDRDRRGEADKRSDEEAKELHIADGRWYRDAVARER